MPYLIVTADGKELHRRELLATTVLGRSLGCDVWVGDPALSREHCRLEPSGDQWLVTDMKSRNGTYVRGRPVRTCVLEDGDVIQLGAARATFHAGEFVPARPLDPFQARDAAMLRQTYNPSAGASPAGRASPQPKFTAPAAPASSPPDTSGEVAPYGLAFQRPPAQPIVKNVTPATPAPRRTGSWMSSLVSSVGGGLRGRKTAGSTSTH